MLIKIELEDKEFYAISVALSRQNRRRRFGAIGLTAKIRTQLLDLVPVEKLEEFRVAWEKTKNDVPPTPPKKKLKVIKKKVDTTRVWNSSQKQ